MNKTPDFFNSNLKNKTNLTVNNTNIRSYSNINPESDNLRNLQSRHNNINNTSKYSRINNPSENINNENNSFHNLEQNYFNINQGNKNNNFNSHLNKNKEKIKIKLNLNENSQNFDSFNYSKGILYNFKIEEDEYNTKLQNPTTFSNNAIKSLLNNEREKEFISLNNNYQNSPGKNINNIHKNNSINLGKNQNNNITTNSQIGFNIRIIKRHGIKTLAGKNDNGAKKINQDNYVTMENILNCEEYKIYGVFDGHGNLFYFIFILKEN